MFCTVQSTRTQDILRAATPMASVFTKLPRGVQARAILDLLRTAGKPLTRHEIYDGTKHIISSKTKCKKILRQLVQKHRIKPFLEFGKTLGQDPFSYKLNPQANKKNFPDIYGTPSQKMRYKRFREVAEAQWRRKQELYQQRASTTSAESTAEGNKHEIAHDIKLDDKK